MPKLQTGRMIVQERVHMARTIEEVCEWGKLHREEAGRRQVEVAFGVTPLATDDATQKCFFELIVKPRGGSYYFDVIGVPLDLCETRLYAEESKVWPGHAEAWREWALSQSVIDRITGTTGGKIGFAAPTAPGGASADPGDAEGN
jgi:hypothetical protein